MEINLSKEQTGILFRQKAKEFADDISTSMIYKLLSIQRRIKKHPSKFHRKAYNHLTKSIKRLNQIAMEDY